MTQYPFHPQVQDAFPGFDYRTPAGDRDVVCDMRNPKNLVGHQQRAFSVRWALDAGCGPTDLGLDFGSPKGLTPYCIHVDVFGTGASHPFYGGGAYLADVAADAADAAFLRQLPERSFPFLGSNHSLEHMPAAGDDGIRELLVRWLCLLRPGGIFALVLPDNDAFDVIASDRDHKHAWGASDFRARVLDPVLAGLRAHDATRHPSASGPELLEYDTFHNHFSFNAVVKR